MTIRNPNQHTVAIVQARMGASRLPGKVLEHIAGEPMLVRVVDRTRRADLIDEVVVATSTQPEDGAIDALCQSKGYPCYRGSLHDVLDRYYQAARWFSADVIVRLTADCPLIDPQVIDQTVAAFLGQVGEFIIEGKAQPISVRNDRDQVYLDFAANRLPPPWRRTFPIGLDTEVCTFNALQIAWQEADQAHQREHVMPYLYEHPERFRVLLINHEPDYGRLRWTVDTADDLELVRRIYSRLGARRDFNWLDVLSLFEQNPELAGINAFVQHKHLKNIDERVAHRFAGTTGKGNDRPGDPTRAPE